MNTHDHQGVHIWQGKWDSPRMVQFARLLRHTQGRRKACTNGPLWGLDYHEEDAGEYSLDGKTWQPRTRDTAHLYAPGTRYWERSTAVDVPFWETYFVFEAASMPELQAMTAATAGFARFTDDAKMLRGAFMHPVFTATGTHRQHQAQGLLLLVLPMLVSAQGRGDGEYAILPGDGGTEQTLAHQVNRYLLAHYEERILLEEMARHIGVSRSTLTHGYRMQTGTTPMARLTQYRMDAARAMILRGDRIKVVALRTGFCDEYHLSKAFKRHFGHSPRQYLQDIHGELRR